jgi:hypothetical protein
MSAPAGYKLVGRCRIGRSRHLGSRYLNLSGPATIAITDDARSKPASTSNTVGSRSGSLTWQGFDEMDEGSNDGSAESLATARSKSTSPTTMATRPLKAKRGTSPTACQCKLRRLCLAKVNFSDLRSDTSQIFAFALADKNNYTPGEDSSLGGYGTYSMHLGNLLWQ